MPRTRYVESERELERSLDDFITRGYKVKDQGQFSARVKEKDWGSLPVHGFVFLFSFIAGAVVFDAADLGSGGVWVVAILAIVTYAVYSWLTADEVLLKVDEDRAD
jgi:uncharacterized membrane protein YoaK (UPF0700 family)